MTVITTWNLENLYRPGGEFGPGSAEVYEKKLDYLAARIDDISPDLLAVQEIGDPQALADLLERLPGTWHTALSAHPDARGIRVGILSRTEISETVHVTAFPKKLLPVQSGDAPGTTTDTMGRGALHIATTTGGQRIEVLTAHLKSKLLTYPSGRFSPRNEDERARYGAYALYRRTAEAAALRAYTNTLLEDGTASVVVLGDMNDTEPAATTGMLYGPPGSQLGTGGFDRPDKGDRHRLWNIASAIPEEDRFSRIHEGSRELIDHILLSHSLVKKLDSAESFTQDLTSIGNNPPSRRQATRPDHAPVTARIG
ncbi:MAG: endonuclease/exonuclease/phosphatase family protein [Specibacter sp.]